MKYLLFLLVLSFGVACGGDDDNNTTNNANNQNNANNGMNNANNQNNGGGDVSVEECQATCEMRGVTDCGEAMADIQPICETQVCYEKIPSDFHQCLEDVPCGTLLAAFANGSGVCGITPN